MVLMAFTGSGPPADDAAIIAVFAEPNAAPVATASETKPSETKPSEPAEPTLEALAAAIPPPPSEELPRPTVPMLDAALPPPPEASAAPDFKTPPPPPPPRPAPAAPRPSQPKSAPTAPAQAAPSAPAAALPSAPSSVAPGWNALLAAWLAAHKTYPEAARRRHQEGDVTVRFTVEGDGRVSDVVVVQGSGFATLDSATLALLRGATLPPPGTETTRTVRIRFRLSD